MTNCNSYSNTLSVDAVVDLVSKCPPGPWPSGWAHQDNVIAAHKIMADRFIADWKPSGKYFPQDRGIVMCGGGLKYLPSVWVHLNLLRRMGCTLPVQLWHLGPEEIDPYFTRLLKRLDVECVDALALPEAKEARILCGWELKLFATWFSPYRNVLFLDADSCPVVNPEYLFKSRPFLESGAIFWPDYDMWTLKADVWGIFGIDWMASPEAANREPALESGQFMVDKTRCEREFSLARWYADHSDFTFTHVYGDKETFHLAWRKLRSEYATCRRPPGWNEHTIVQWDVEQQGKVLFQHRVQDKWRLSGTNRFIESLANESESFQLVRELQTLWSGVSWENPAPSPTELAMVAALVGTRWWYERVGFDRRILRFGTSSRISEGSAECEERWWINEVPKDGGGTEMILTISRIDRPTCHLRADGSGGWIGRWIRNEQMPIKLERVVP